MFELILFVVSLSATPCIFATNLLQLGLSHLMVRATEVAGKVIFPYF